ncbi:MAG: NfeD family protein [Acidobacteriota bacterium]|nr:NfeD family protein [Acidobacteriota bacterium]
MDSLQEWLRPQFLWFGLGVVLLLMEFANPGVVLIFFALGAWLVALLCMTSEISLNLQLGVFVVSSVVLLLVFRNRIKGRINRPRPAAGGVDSDEFVGGRALVTREIRSDRTGRVDYRGTTWEAESGERIREGAAVEILDKENLTLTVKKI